VEEVSKSKVKSGIFTAASKDNTTNDQVGTTVESED